jgi:hypothetical protein
MRSWSWSLVLVASIWLPPIPASAQERGHAAFVYGWTFGEETASLYGGQFGVGLGGNFSIVGGLEKLDDILTGRYALFLNDIAGLPGVEVTARIPGVYYGGGLRWMFPGGRLSPFVQAEFGATKLSPEVTVIQNGQDVTDDVFGTDELDETAATFAFGGGLRANFGGNALAEVTFKFFDVLADEEISINRLSFAFGLRF